VALAIVVLAAWRGWRWPVVVAGMLALPAFFTLSPSMLVGVIPFGRAAFSSWARSRVQRDGRTLHTQGNAPSSILGA
jgi:hypothetical protein